MDQPSDAPDPLRESSLEALLAIVERNRAADKWVQVRLATIGAGLEQCIAARLVWGVEPSAPGVRSYPTCTFREFRLSSTAAVELLSQAMAGTFTLGSASIAVRIAAQHWVRTPSGRSWSEYAWPTDVLHCALTLEPTALRPDAIARTGLPPFDSLLQAVAVMIHDTPRLHARYANRHLQFIHAVVPDFRGRVSNASWTSNSLVVNCEGDPVDSLAQLQVVYSTDRGQRNLFEDAQSECKFDCVPVDCEEIEICLIAGDTVLSQIQLTSRSRKYPQSPEPAEGSSNILEIVAGGERETVEFKPFVRGASEKSNEIVKTVVAFANTAGGKLLFGVRDDGSFEGELGARKALGTDDPSRVFETWVVKLVSDSVRPVPEIRIASHRVGDAPIVVLEVISAPGQLYQDHSNNIWIRRGATNRRPDMTTELQDRRTRTRF